MTVELTRYQKIWITRRKRHGPSGFSKEGTLGVKGVGRGNRGRKHRPRSEKTKAKISKAIRGPNHPNWNGGQYLRSGGYVYVWKPDHPYATKAGYVPRSHLVMEEHLGRYLEPGEIVHHEGERDDDRIEMLILFPPEGVHIAYHHSLKKGLQS